MHGVPKASQAVGSQLTSVDNVSNTHVAEVNYNMTLEVKIIQAAGDESANDFTLFWGFCSDSVTTNAPTQLATNEFSLVCNLTTGSTTRYYMTPIIQPTAQILNVWYDCDNLTVPLTSVDITLNQCS
jgi:hypothetical protein